MDVTATGVFLRFFSDMPDPRGVNKIHKLHDMIVIAVMAVICGADEWAQVALFGGSIDAMGTQREIAKTIVDGQGDYVLSVKENQPALHQKVKALLEDAALGPVAGLKVGHFEQSNEDHGRIKTRQIRVVNDMHWLDEDLLKLWPGLAGGSLALVQRTRQNLGNLSGKITLEWHYYISTLKGCDDAAAKTMAHYIPGHWAVENNLHWQLDMSFNEDQRRIRKGNGAENFSRLCPIALNLLKKDTSVKSGIKAKRLNAGWDHDYLLNLIAV